MRAGRALLLALGTGLGTVLPVPARAQTLFAWPDTTVDVAKYATIEDCQAVVDRSIYSTTTRDRRASGIMRDTMPLDLAEQRETQPAPVEATAQRCMKRFAAADSAPLSHFSALLPLYLQAGWDDEAGALIERELAAIGADLERAANGREARAAEARLAAAIDTAVEIALGRGRGPDVRPARFAMARGIVMAHAPRVSSRLERIDLYRKVLLLQSDLTPDGKLLDTARLVRDGARLAAVVDSLTERERSELSQRLGVPEDLDVVEAYNARLERTIGWHVYLDTLRRSTARYVELMRDSWSRSTGMRPETYGFGYPLGERAPSIEADIWLGREDGSGPRPTPGRVSLFVFLDAAECTGVVDSPSEMYGDCARVLVPLRRLMERFPALEVTIVAEAHGYFMYLKDSMTAEREAELTKRWLESYGVTAPLAMSVPDSWNLGRPDGRTIRPPTGNRTSYSFGRSRGITNGNAYLVDEDGIIVHVRQMNRHSVGTDYAKLVALLLERRLAGR